MAINGTITPSVLHENSAAIIKRFGIITYLRCWFAMMILHRHTQFTECVFACLNPDASAADARTHVHAHP